MAGTPDNKTMEMAAYGSAYLPVTSTLEQLDRVVEANELARPTFVSLEYEPLLNLYVVIKEHYDRIISEDPFSEVEIDFKELESLDCLTATEEDVAAEYVAFKKLMGSFNFLGVDDEVFMDTILEVRELIRNIAADDLLAGWKTEIEKYGRFVGQGEFSVQMQSKGITPDLWKAANQYVERED